MPWARLEDDYFRHRKVVGLSKDAKLLDLAAITFSSRELRDGVLMPADLRILAAEVDLEDVVAVADELVAAERWGKVDRHYVIHDYLKYNPSRAEVLAEREAARERRRTALEKRKNGSAEKPPDVEPESGLRSDEQQPNVRPENGRNSAVNTYIPEPGYENTYIPELGTRRRARDARELRVSPPRPKRSAKAPPGDSLLPFNADLAQRIQAIALELGDDNAAASITRAVRYQAATRLSVGQMANAIKDAFRRTEARLGDGDAKPLGSPMAYFLGVLEQTTQERSSA